MGEPPYALPQKAVARANNTYDGVDGPEVRMHQASQGMMGEGDGPGGDLDAMLGNLSTDLNKQGVNTVPKGHCAACAKPIVGQVSTYDIEKKTVWSQWATREIL